LKNFKIHNILVNFKNLFFFVEKEIDNNSKNFLSDFDKLYTHDKYEIIDAEKSNINFNIDNDNFFKKNQHMLKNNISRFYQENLDDLGYVFKVSDDIVYARGLLKVQMSEMVKFEKEGESIYGIVNYLDNEGVVGVTVLGDASKITAQTVVNRTLKQPKIGAGYGYVGRVVNPLGEAIDGNGKINFELEVNIEKNAPGIIERKPVREPLETGIKFIDAMIPIGCGQRD
jgi:F0F1-type ATP synthase alpha subunit